MFKFKTSILLKIKKKSNNSVAEPFKDVIKLNMHPFTSTIRWLYKKKLELLKKNATFCNMRLIIMK